MLESSPNHPLHPQSMGKMSPMKLVPGARKVGDHLFIKLAWDSVGAVEINEIDEFKTYFGQDMDKTYLDKNSQFLLTGRSWGRGEGNYLLLSTSKQS